MRSEVVKRAGAEQPAVSNIHSTRIYLLCLDLAPRPIWHEDIQDSTCLLIFAVFSRRSRRANFIPNYMSSHNELARPSQLRHPATFPRGRTFHNKRHITHVHTKRSPKQSRIIKGSKHEYDHTHTHTHTRGDNTTDDVTLFYKDFKTRLRPRDVSPTTGTLQTRKIVQGRGGALLETVGENPTPKPNTHHQHQKIGGWVGGSRRRDS